MQGQIQTGSDAIMQVGEKLFPGFSIADEDRRRIYEKIFYLFADSDKVAGFGLRKEKGIFLVGDIGVGKTVLMKTMQVLFRETERKFRWVNCLAFKDMLEEGMTAAEIKTMYGRSFKCDLYIDDLGLGKSDYNKYGNVTNIISEIIFERDELYVSENFRTHLSSNIPTTVSSSVLPEVKSIERMYGDRILDRIKQMCNLIQWTGKSLRK